MINGKIYVLGTIAHDATQNLMETNKRELEAKFPPFFMRLVRNFCRDENLTSRRIRELLPQIREAASYCAEMEKGGILNALWYMAESAGTGFEIRLRDIPIAQQTVEVLETFDENPYYASSYGTWLVLSEEPARLEGILNTAGIPFAMIGSTRDGRARTILNGETVRYLDRPKVF